MRTTRTAGSLVTLALAGVLLAACSGGGDAATTGATPPPTVASTPDTSTPVTTAPPGSAAGDGGAAPAANAPGRAPAGSAPAAGSAPEEPAADGTPRCTSAELALSLGAGDAGAGSNHIPLVFTNTGSRTCELRGFPGVSYVAGDDGHQIGLAAAMSGQRGGQINIAPRHTAVAPLQLVNAQNFDAGACKPTPVRGLRVYPPGDTASLFVPLGAGAMGCAGTPPDPQLMVQTMQAP